MAFDNCARGNPAFQTQRKKDVVQYDYGDNGKTAHFAVIIENGGKQGLWEANGFGAHTVGRTDEGKRRCLWHIKTDNAHERRTTRNVFHLHNRWL
jgi:hypothetical protein